MVAVGLAAMSFVTPWWTIQTQGAFFHWPVDGTRQLGLFGWTLQWSTSGPGPNQTTTQSSNYANQTEMGTVFRVALVLDIAGTACGAAMVAFMAIPRLRPSLRNGVPVLGGLGFLFVLAAAIFVLIQLPAAANADLFPSALFQSGSSPTVSAFWGSGSVFSPHYAATASYGAGWAWYALVAASGLFLADPLLWVHLRGSQAAAAFRPEN